MQHYPATSFLWVLLLASCSIAARPRWQTGCAILLIGAVLTLLAVVSSVQEASDASAEGSGLNPAAIAQGCIVRFGGSKVPFLVFHIEPCSVSGKSGVSGWPAALGYDEKG